MAELYAWLTALVGLFTLLGSTMLALWSLGAWRAAPVRPPGPAGQRLAIVMPAHDEESGLAATLASVTLETQADGATDLWVVADNCTDDTAGVARRHGVGVLERNDPSQRGKGHALAFAFAQLADRGYDWLVVIDADSSLQPGFLQALRQAMAHDSEVVQAAYYAKPTHSTKARLARLAQLGFNLVRSAGRAWLGGSAGILGNGFALRSDLVRRIPYDARSVAEDLEYQLRLGMAGVRVDYAPQAVVLGEIAESAQGARTQRARWEGGRFRMIREWTWPLLRQVLRGQRAAWEPLADLLLLPLGLHVGLLLLALSGGHPVGLACGLWGLAAVAFHVLTIAAKTPATRQDLGALAMAPLYILWKLSMLPLTLMTSRSNAAWVRTERTPAPPTAAPPDSSSAPPKDPPAP